MTSTSSLIEATDNGMDLDFARVPDLLNNFTVNIHPNGTITLTPKEKERKKPGFIDIPIEIRNEIYRLLLVNPIQAESSSVGKEGGYGANISYEFSLALLRVSKKIYLEASAMLYGQNRFYLSFHDPRFYTCGTNFSPILRYLGRTTLNHANNEHHLSDIPALKKVQQWKAYLVVSAPVTHSPWRILRISAERSVTHRQTT
jgi:hypothetical protein